MAAYTGTTYKVCMNLKTLTAALVTALVSETFLEYQRFKTPLGNEDLEKVKKMFPNITRLQKKK